MSQHANYQIMLKSVFQRIRSLIIIQNDESFQWSAVKTRKYVFKSPLLRFICDKNDESRFKEEQVNNEFFLFDDKRAKTKKLYNVLTHRVTKKLM